MTTFAQRLEDSIVQAGITRKRLAEMIDVDQHTITSWTTGSSKPQTRRYFAIAEALKVDANWLQTGYDGGAK